MLVGTEDKGMSLTTLWPFVWILWTNLDQRKTSEEQQEEEGKKAGTMEMVKRESFKKTASRAEKHAPLLQHGRSILIDGNQFHGWFDKTQPHWATSVTNRGSTCGTWKFQRFQCARVANHSVERYSRMFPLVWPKFDKRSSVFRSLFFYASRWRRRAGPIFERIEPFVCFVTSAPKGVLPSESGPGFCSVC